MTVFEIGNICVIGDMHFKPNNKQETDKVLSSTIKIINNSNIAFIVVLGDTLDNHEKIDMKCFIRMENFIDELSKLKMTYILIGNHDRINNKVFMTTEHVFGPFKRWNNVHIVDDHCHVIEWKNMKVCFVPYVPNGRFMEALAFSNINLNEINLVFSHSEFANCSINKISGSKCDEWLPHFPLNIAGHIHSFEHSSDNLIYVGTPFQHSFGENDKNKGIFIINEDLNLELRELNIPKKVTQRIDYTEINNVKINKNEKTRLIISGPKAMVKEILSNVELQERFNDVKIMFNDSETSKKRHKIKFRTTMSFIDRLSSALDANPDMKILFSNFFDEE